MPFPIHRWCVLSKGHVTLRSRINPVFFFQCVLLLPDITTQSRKCIVWPCTWPNRRPQMLHANAERAVNSDSDSRVEIFNITFFSRMYKQMLSKNYHRSIKVPRIIYYISAHLSQSARSVKTFVTHCARVIFGSYFSVRARFRCERNPRG